MTPVEVPICPYHCDCKNVGTNHLIPNPQDSNEYGRVGAVNVCDAHLPEYIKTGRWLAYPYVGQDIDAYGDYTVKRWFSAGPEMDRFKENVRERGAGKSLTIMSLGLAGEVGEVTEHIKKFFRDGVLDASALRKELADVIYYWARVCMYFGFKPSEILAESITKLEGRIKRGTMHGSGDNR